MDVIWKAGSLRQMYNQTSGIRGYALIVKTMCPSEKQTLRSACTPDPSMVTMCDVCGFMGTRLAYRRQVRQAARGVCSGFLRWSFLTSDNQVDCSIHARCDATGPSVPPQSSGEAPALHRQPVLYAADEGKACSCGCSSTNMAPALFVCFK